MLTLHLCTHFLLCHTHSFSNQRQELESANKRLKKDLNELRVSLTAVKGSRLTAAYNVLLDQLNSTTEELDMRKEEVLMLHTQLVSLEGFKFKVWSYSYL